MSEKESEGSIGPTSSTSAEKIPLGEDLANPDYALRLDTYHVALLCSSYAKQLLATGFFSTRELAMEGAKAEFERLKTNETDWKEFVRRANLSPSDGPKRATFKEGEEEERARKGILSNQGVVGSKRPANFSSLLSEDAMTSCQQVLLNAKKAKTDEMMAKAIASMPVFTCSAFTFVKSIKPILAAVLDFAEGFLQQLKQAEPPDETLIAKQEINVENLHLIYAATDEFLMELHIKHLFPGGSQKLIDDSHRDEIMEALGATLPEEKRAELKKL